MQGWPLSGHGLHCTAGNDEHSLHITLSQLSASMKVADAAYGLWQCCMQRPHGGQTLSLLIDWSCRQQGCVSAVTDFVTVILCKASEPVAARHRSVRTYCMQCQAGKTLLQFATQWPSSIWTESSARLASAPSNEGLCVAGRLELTSSCGLSELPRFNFLRKGLHDAGPNPKTSIRTEH